MFKVHIPAGGGQILFQGILFVCILDVRNYQTAVLWYHVNLAV